MDVSSFNEMAGEFAARTTRIVWCATSTIDLRDRTRMRILHPIWQGTEGWITTERHSHKAKHLARNPHLSLCYLDVSDPSKGFDPVYVDCVADWDDRPESRRRVWELYKSTPPPLGYDPGTIWKGPDDPDFGLLNLQPWRIEVESNEPGVGITRKVWRP